MNIDVEFLAKVDLFRNIEKENIASMLQCLGSSTHIYKKNEILFMAGEAVPGVGIVLTGRLQIIQEDILGNKTIVGQLAAGEIFAETIVCSGIKQSPVTVAAAADCEVMFLQFKRLVTTCSSACAFHAQLIENMMNILAAKNMHMTKKNRILSQRSIYEKLRQFFMDKIEENGSYKFNIPFSRSQLADYLCVDRSALSRELSKMQTEGIISFTKNEFEIINL